MKKKFKALLLLGPTGAGKTPLGEYLEQHGLAGRRCFHFDFGAHLRAIAAGRDVPRALKPADLDVIRQALAGNVLLENRNFHIARDIFKDFIRRRKVKPADLIVLNGLPRHAGQAGAMRRLVEVKAVVMLECSPETVAARIRQNTGGDRTGRGDDSPAEVERKLQIYRARTLPLLDHYQMHQTPRIEIAVDSATTPAAMSAQLAAQLAAGPHELAPGLHRCKINAT